VGEGVTGAGVLGLLLGYFVVGEVVGLEVGLGVVAFSVEAGVGCGVIGAGVGTGVTGAGVGEGVTGAGVGLLLADFVGELGAAAFDRRRDAGTAPTVDRASRWAYLSSRTS
jgi:hypothetical protein